MTAAVDVVRLAAGPVELELLPSIGARVHRLRAHGVDLIRTPAEFESHRSDPYFWGAYVMAPWCNRIDARPTQVGDRLVDVPPSFSDGSAIHGQVVTRPWTVIDRGPGTARLEVDGGGDGWPWRYRVTLTAAVAPASLTLGLELRNLEAAAMPGGLGLHPWFLRPLDARIPAAAALSNVDPDGEFGAVPPEADLSTRRAIPDDLDVSLQPGRPGGTLWRPDADLQLELEVQLQGPPYLAVASPAGLDAIAVEAQSHAPQGLRRLLDGRAGGLTLVPPGGRLTLALVIRLAGG